MAFTITIAGTDYVLDSPLEQIRIENAIDSVSKMTVVIWDESNSLSINTRDVIAFKDGSTCVFAGWVLQRGYAKKGIGRLITVTAAGFDLVLDERIVGAPDGGNFTGVDAQGRRTAVDPNARTYATDQVTIQNLFAAYVSIAGITLDTTTKVGNFASFRDLVWSHLTLRTVIAECVEMTGPFVRLWFDPSAYDPLSPTIYVVWQDLSNPSSLPAAPFSIDEASPDYSTSFPLIGADMEWDSQATAEIVFLEGQTDYAWNTVQTITFPIGPSGDVQTITTGSPAVFPGGLGWYPAPGPPAGTGGQDPSKRQMLLQSDATTWAERQQDGAFALPYAMREIFRGKGTVYHDSGIFQIGQGLAVNYPSLDVSGTFAIQAVTTTFRAGDGKRQSELQFGDAQKGRLTKRRPPLTAAVTTSQAVQLQLTLPNTTPEPGTFMFVDAYLQNASLLGIPVTGKTVTWDATYYYRNGVLLASPPVSFVNATTTLDGNGHTTNSINYLSGAQDGDVFFPLAYITL